MTERCTLCGRALTAPVYSDAGAAYGSTCAERVGLVRAPTPRDATRTPLRVPRGGEDARQLGLEWAEACATFAADYQAALDAQRDVWVVAECARDISEPRHVEDVAEQEVRDPGPSMHPDLTDKQAAILAWVADYIERTKFPPTLREIGTAFGIGSTNGVNDHLLRLERKGYIERCVGGLSRGMRLTDKAKVR